MSDDARALRRLVEPLRELAQDCAPALVAAVFPELAAIALAVHGGVALKRVLNSRVTAARIDGLARMLGRMHVRIAEVRSRKPLDLRRELLRPDIVFLLQAARDHYAVEQFDARLKRLAAVVSGRIIDPDRPFDVDLEFARAALDLSDDAVRFLAIAVSRAAEGATIGHRQDGPPEKQPIPGELRVSMYVRSRPWRAASAVAMLGASLRTLEARGMIENAGFISGMEAVNCDDRATARYRDNVWVPTALGTEFMQRIDAATDDGPDACSGTEDTNIES